MLWERNIQDFGLHNVKHIGNGRKCRLTQRGGLHRCQVRQGFLYKADFFQAEMIS